MARHPSLLALRSRSPPKGCLTITTTNNGISNKKRSLSPKMSRKTNNNNTSTPAASTSQTPLVRFQEDDQLATTIIFERVQDEFKQTVWYTRQELDMCLKEDREAIEDRQEEMGPNPGKHVVFDNDECTWRGLEHARDNINRVEITSEYVSLVVLAYSEQLANSNGKVDVEEIRRQAKQWSKPSRGKALQLALMDAKEAGTDDTTSSSSRASSTKSSRAERVKRNMSGSFAKLKQGFFTNAKMPKKMPSANF